MKGIFKKLLLITCLTSFSFPLFSYKPREEFSDPWEYLRQEFVTKYNYALRINMEWIAEKIESIFFKLENELHTKINPELQTIFIHSLLHEYVSFKILKQFLDEWEENKKFTPEKLHDLFDRHKKDYTIWSDEMLIKASVKIVEKMRKLFPFK